MVIAGFNLATEDYRREQRKTLLTAGMAVVLALLLMGQAAAWFLDRRDARATGSRIAQMETELDGLRAIRAGIPDAAVKRYEAKVSALNKILEASAFSWTGLLMELERAVPPGVALSEILPDLASGRVVLRGTARTFDDLGRLLRGLAERIAFRDIYLTRQAERKTQGGGQGGLDFVVTLTYQGRQG